jgi:alkylation response protein AidB-like acyl-CoA dehydrogenase
LSSSIAPAEAHYLAKLSTVIHDVIAPLADRIDQQAEFPREAMKALGQAGLLGLISAQEVGGMGESHRAATAVVEQLARVCMSTAMVTCMHYCATAVIEAHGRHELREAIAAGNHVSTLAFSETGSRSHFWAPVGTAARQDGKIVLNGSKSWVTSASEADSYVWSSQPLEAMGASTLWLIDSRLPGLQVAGAFDGLGLRGNASSPITAKDIAIGEEDRLGADGAGFDLMMGVIVPYFNLMTAAVGLGNMQAAVDKAVHHVSGTRYAHLDQSIADFPTVRAYLARMRIKTDMVQALLLDGLNALEQGREDTLLRLLEVKAAAGETATEVTDLAMRVCGGAAFRKEGGVERNFRDARAGTVMAPTTDVLYDFIGKAICGMPVF